MYEDLITHTFSVPDFPAPKSIKWAPLKFRAHIQSNYNYWLGDYKFVRKQAVPGQSQIGNSNFNSYMLYYILPCTRI